MFRKRQSRDYICGQRLRSEVRKPDSKVSEKGSTPATPERRPDPRPTPCRSPAQLGGAVSGRSPEVADVPGRGPSSTPEARASPRVPVPCAPQAQRAQDWQLGRSTLPEATNPGVLYSSLQKGTRDHSWVTLQDSPMWARQHFNLGRAA